MRARAWVQAGRPSAMKALSVSRSKTRRFATVSKPASSSVARSSTNSPIATPARGRGSAVVLKMPKGRFWIGKCESGATSMKADRPDAAIMSAAGPPQGANCAPSGGSAAAVAASVGVHICAAGRGGPPLRLAGEVLRQPPPAVEVVLLPLRRLQREARGADDVAAFEHEGERVLDFLWLERAAARLLERRRIGPVTRHAVVQAGASRHEALRLGVVDAVHQAHELAHH